MDQAIVVEQLVKRCRDFAAVDGVSFAVRHGTIFGLLGRHGAEPTAGMDAFGRRSARTFRWV